MENTKWKSGAEQLCHFTLLEEEGNVNSSSHFLSSVLILLCLPVLLLYYFLFRSDSLVSSLSFTFLFFVVFFLFFLSTQTTPSLSVYIHPHLCKIELSKFMLLVQVSCSER